MLLNPSESKSILNKNIRFYKCHLNIKEKNRCIFMLIIFGQWQMSLCKTYDDSDDGD